MGSVLKTAHKAQGSGVKAGAQNHLCILEGQSWVHKAAHIVSAALGSEETTL